MRPLNATPWQRRCWQYWVKLRGVVGDDTLKLSTDLPVLYLFNEADEAVLARWQRLCRRRGWPSPQQPWRVGNRTLWPYSHCVLTPEGEQLSLEQQRWLSTLAASVHEAQIVPVAVSWGRAPARDLRQRRPTPQAPEPPPRPEQQRLGAAVARHWGRCWGYLGWCWRGRQLWFWIGAPLSLAALRANEASEQAKLRRALQGALRGQLRAFYGSPLADKAAPRARPLLQRLAWRWWLGRGVGQATFTGLGELRLLARRHTLALTIRRRPEGVALISLLFARWGLAPPQVIDAGAVSLSSAADTSLRGQGDEPTSAPLRRRLTSALRSGRTLLLFIESQPSTSGYTQLPDEALLATLLAVADEQAALLQERPLCLVPLDVTVESANGISLAAFAPTGEGRWGEWLRWLWRLRYGTLHCRLGEPLIAAGPPLLGPQTPKAVQEVAFSLAARLNAAVVVSPGRLLMLSLLSAPRAALAMPELHRQIELTRDLIRQLAPSRHTAVTALDGWQIIEHGEFTGQIQRRPHAISDILSLPLHYLARQRFDRNGLAHLLLLASVVANMLLQRPQWERETLIFIGVKLYPWLRRYGLLVPPVQAAPRELRKVLTVFQQQQLLQYQGERKQWLEPAPTVEQRRCLELLAQPALIPLQLLCLALALARQAGPHRLQADSLAERCFEGARYLAMVDGDGAIEQIERGRCRVLIDTLVEQQWLFCDGQGRLAFDHDTLRDLRGIELLLPEAQRSAIYRLASLA